MKCMCGKPAVILLDGVPFCAPKVGPFGPSYDWCALGLCAYDHECRAEERAA